MSKELNRIPMLTWNRLKVNYASLSLFDASGIPEFKNYKEKGSEYKTSPKPEQAEKFKSVETGMGEEMTDFVSSYGNCRSFFDINDNRAELELYYDLDNTDTLIDEALVYVHRDAEAVIIQKYTSGADANARHAGQTKLYLEENSKVKLIQIQMLGSRVEHFSDIGAVLKDGADLSVVRIELGAGNIAAGCKAELAGKKASFDIDSIYYGDGDRYLDFNDVAKHIGKKSNSNISAKGALFGACRKTYRGTIDFIQGSKGATGDEAESTMVFSPDCVNKSVPLILCGEEDVVGHHAASIGRIDEELMFYMMSRGFDEELIRHMMIESSFAPTISKLPSEELRQEVLSFRSLAPTQL